jgi:hypothetical protein
MRLYFRLIMLNVVAVSLLLVPRFHHIGKNTPVFVLVAITPFAVMAANFLIARKIADHGGISSLDGSRWWSMISIAWALGPLAAGAIPFFIAGAIIRPDLRSVLDVAVTFFWALKSAFDVYMKETK